ncbi:uncharacterized protein LOC141595042 [Silene latifolia]|uniref:uncharacterized protein LOC141595042 n=1 Tax=Silene latifolia TaxID=37657 RepID=UPI003D7743E4
MKASRFILIDGVLFRKYLAGPYLRSLDREESQAILHGLHSGECGNHAGGRSLSNKALRQGYFLPTMRKDAMEFAKNAMLVRDMLTSATSQQSLCIRWNISLKKSTLRNPQSNGQAESSNKIIVENLKKKLEERGENGQKSCLWFSGLTEPHPRLQHDKLPSAWCLEQKQSFHPR